MNAVVGLTDLSHWFFFPRFLQGIDFFLAITTRLWKYTSGMMKQINVFVFRTAQHNIIKESAFLLWRLRMEQKDVTGVLTLRAVKLTCCRLWWPRTSDPGQGETGQVWPETGQIVACRQLRAGSRAEGETTACLEVKIFSFTQLPTCREGN